MEAWQQGLASTSVTSPFFFAPFSAPFLSPFFNVKANHLSASTARLHPTRKVSEANKQPGRGERSERAVQHTRGPRSGRAVWYSKPPLGRAEQRSSVRIKTLALSERSEFASVPNAASSARDRVSGTDVARLFFAYFLLAKQKKVSRPPGRDPASPRSEEKQAQQTPQKQTFFAYLLSPKPKKSKSPPVPKNIFQASGRKPASMPVNPTFATLPSMSQP